MRGPDFGGRWVIVPLLVVLVAIGIVAASGQAPSPSPASSGPDGLGPGPGASMVAAASASGPPSFAVVGPSGPPGLMATPGPTSGPTPRATRIPRTPPPPSPRPASPPPPSPVPIPPLSACPVLPATNVWNDRIDGLPIAADSATMIAAIGLGATLHPDFSATGYGIPFNVVGTATPRSTVAFDYADESDPGPYPIPTRPRIEGGSDRHLLLVDTNACRLYELYDAVHGTSGWTAGSGAIWSLASNALRPAGWTSADAAGLPIFPGLVRYAEVAAGAIRHAIRFTAPATCAGYVYPARDEAGSGSCSVLPPMGLRVRLKASVSTAGFGPQAQVILTALKRYGMLLADNGSPWYITGAPDSRWNDDELHALGQLTGADFEVVDTSGLVNG